MCVVTDSEGASLLKRFSEKNDGDIGTCCMLTFPSSMSKGGRTEHNVRPMHTYDIIVIEPVQKTKIR